MAGETSKFTNIRTFPLGGVLIQEGPNSPKEMIVVLQGNVGVYKNYKLNSEKQLKVISQGGFHGEMALFLNQEQGETLVALSNVIVFVVDRKNVTEFFVKQPDMAVTIVEGICRMADESSATLKKLLPGSGEEEPSRKSSLFPEGQGSYSLKLANSSEFLYPTKTVCPLCSYTFDSLGMITSKLRLDRTDPDLRTRYRDFEPLYYEMITCPNCFFSASGNQFEGVSKRHAGNVNQAVGPYKLDVYIRTGLERDTFTVFAGYYLAILCAPIIFDDYQLITANLWTKISRLYQDVGDDRLYMYASEKALADYLYAYEHLRVSEKSSQQLCYMIGDLYFKTGDVDKARNFFFLAKSNKEGTAVMQRQADMRMEEIRVLVKGGSGK